MIDDWPTSKAPGWIHPAYGASTNGLTPGEDLGDTASRAVGKPGTIITYANGRYYVDPELRITGNSYIFVKRFGPDRAGEWIKLER